MSYNAKLGYMFVNTNELGAIGEMKEQPPGSPVRYRRASSVGEYARFWDPDLLPCQKPPWGLLNAIDLNTGEIAWRVPLGVVAGLEDKKTGAPSIGGSIATAGGLVFIGGTPDRRFRAFDAKTGKELWTVELEASAHATPMTYRGRTGSSTW